MKRYLIRLVGIGIFFLITGVVVAGTWSTNDFFYKPSVGARGEAEKNRFDDGLDRVDARLGKEIWIGDPKYGTTLPAVLAAIGSEEVILRVPKGTHGIRDNLTIPATITLKPERGAILEVDDAKTLTINSPVTIEPYQVFSVNGTGKVALGSGQRWVYPEWWGAKADNATGCTAAINAAIKSGVGHIRFGEGTYKITNVDCNDGRVPPIQNQPGYLSGVFLEGAGMGRTILKQDTTSGVALAFSPSVTQVAAGVSNLTLQGAATAPDYSWQFVSGNHGIDVQNIAWGFTMNNVEIRDFGDTGLKLSNNTYLQQLTNVIIRFCYGWGCVMASSPYGGNSVTAVNLKIMGCVNGLKLDNVYGHSFYNVCIDDEWGVGSGNALYIVNSHTINLFGGYIEWNYSNLSPIINCVSNSNINLFGVVVAAQGGTPPSLVNLENGNYSKIQGCRFIWGGSSALARGVHVKGNANYSEVWDNTFSGNITATITDWGNLSSIRDLGFYTSRLRTSQAQANWGVFGTRVGTMGYDRLTINADGKLLFGPGTAEPATNFYYAGEGLLKTDTKLIAGAGLGVGNSASGDVTGTAKIRKIPVFDASGNSLGYLQVYQGP